MNYIGPSMNPLLRAGDFLQVIPYRDHPIRVGDVVVFRPPDCNHNVVHRVVSVEPEGIRTRGDNNTGVDPWVLRPEEIIGRVVSTQRREREHRMVEGTWGVLFGPAYRLFKRFEGPLCRFLHPFYHSLARSGIIRRWLAPRLQTQVLTFHRPQGQEWQLLLNGQVIGRRLPGQEEWQIRRPYRLVVDVAALPGGEARERARD